MFELGETVEIIEDYYTWTTKGSRGVVIHIWNENSVEVQFDYCPNIETQRGVIGNSFPIKTKYLMSLDSNPLGRLGRKVKTISERHLMKCQ